jgi:hypothetical protein
LSKREASAIAEKLMSLILTSSKTERQWDFSSWWRCFVLGSAGIAQLIFIDDEVVVVASERPVIQKQYLMS